MSKYADPMSTPHAARFHERRISSVTFTSATRRISTVMFTCSGRGPRAGQFVRFWASGGAKFTKMCRSVKGADVYPHMPIVRPHVTRYIRTAHASLAWRLRRRIYNSTKNCDYIPALDADEPPCQNVTPLALSSAEKSVTVQTNTQTVNDRNGTGMQQKTINRWV